MNQSLNINGLPTRDTESTRYDSSSMDEQLNIENQSAHNQPIRAHFTTAGPHYSSKANNLRKAKAKRYKRVGIVLTAGAHNMASNVSTPAHIKKERNSMNSMVTQFKSLQLQYLTIANQVDEVQLEEFLVNFFSWIATVQVSPAVLFNFLLPIVAEKERLSTNPELLNLKNLTLSKEQIISTVTSPIVKHLDEKDKAVDVPDVQDPRVIRVLTNAKATPDQNTGDVLQKISLLSTTVSEGLVHIRHYVAENLAFGHNPQDKIFLTNEELRRNFVAWLQKTSPPQVDFASGDWLNSIPLQIIETISQQYGIKIEIKKRKKKNGLVKLCLKPYLLDSRYQTFQADPVEGGSNDN